VSIHTPAFTTLLALALLVGCRSDPSDRAPNDEEAVRGNVTYRVRMALPPDAVVDVRLEDISRADAPATILSQAQIQTKGKQVPIPFELPYDPKRIEPSHRYSVRATIHGGDGHLLFSSTQAHPVLTQGAPKMLDVVVQPVSATAPERASTNPAAATLEGTYWKLVELRGKPAVSSPDNRNPYFSLRADKKNVVGNGGVNHLMGQYTLDGDKLRLSKIGSTLMAGPEPFMRQEREFLDALEATTTYRIDGQTLELRNGQEVLARFEAQAEPPPVESHSVVAWASRPSISTERSAVVLGRGTPKPLKNSSVTRPASTPSPIEPSHSQAASPAPRSSRS
jgi:putative lipoprotein